MLYFAVCCTRCPYHCLHAWVVSHRLQGYLPCVFYAVGSSLFLLSVCFCLCSLFYRDDVLCWLLLARPFLYAFHAHLRFPVDLVWFRLSCDHGWIRSGSVNVRKQQQQQQHVHFSRAARREPFCWRLSTNGCGGFGLHASGTGGWGFRFSVFQQLTSPRIGLPSCAGGPACRRLSIHDCGGFCSHTRRTGR